MSEVKEQTTAVNAETLGLDAAAKARLEQIKTVTVIGAGTMGNGISHVFAQYGCKVHMVDISREALEKAVAKIGANMDRQVTKNLLTAEDKEAALSRIELFTDMAEAVGDADLVVEAASENIDLKIKIFQELDRLCPEKTILASNTSSISITRIGSFTKRPGKVIGMHFMNPVPVMRLVEIINGYATDKDVTQTVFDLTKMLNKVPCVVNDYPGFISNRILMPLINEAILALQEGVAGVEEIDTIMKLGMAHPMGPLQLADFIGLDTCYSIMNVLHMGFGNQKYAPATLLCNMVQAGFLGAKSGEGFYKYTPGSKELVVSERFAGKQWKI
ncbi:3-hydroxyacyl-CoA dehydrogenase family protein [Taibaiella koreensis]|uniref:3-hydroxyacyl-CoA dehydrogenase family protein n=1 Tax=Taibaiella koreensis TaxID=1268548 RepID=UPI00196935B7|nr:3-hydroxybutyryl-CoA dehydrogenase [Taibaiella koreensis]